MNGERKMLSEGAGAHFGLGRASLLEASRRGSGGVDKASSLLLFLTLPVGAFSSEF